MAAISFDLDEKGELVLKPEVLLEAAFQRLYDADPSPEHGQAMMDFKFIKLMYEEEGMYQEYFGTEKLVAVNTNVYGVGSPKIDKKRLELRDHAGEVFLRNNETLEGRSLALIKRRVYIIQQVLAEKDLDLGQLKGNDAESEKRLQKYLMDSDNLSGQLLKLTKSTNEILEQIKKQGGRTKVKNQAGAATSPNESGVFGKSNIMSRRKLRDDYSEEKAK